MFCARLVSLFGVLACALSTAHGAPASLGIFEQESDVGNVLHPGSAEYDPGTNTYVVTGSGENMWFATDEFHFVWKTVSAEDITLTAELTMLGSGGDGHRKGVLMIRQSLDQDSAYVDVARHGDGLTSLQFREQKGAATREVESAVSGPSRLRLEKQGNRFYVWVAGQNEELHFAGGSAKVEIHAPFYVGIGVCAHNKDAVQKVAFKNVEVMTNVSHLKANYSTVETVLQSGDARVGYVSSDHLTAPGWSVDGQALTFEIDGKPQQTPFTPLKTAAPVGHAIAAQPQDQYTYFASNQGGGTTQIWRKLGEAGQPEQITSDEFNNLSPHLSPDGKFLVFLSYPKTFNSVAEAQDVELRIMSIADRHVKTLAPFVGGQGSLGTQPWSPDGRRVVFISYQSMQ